MLTRTFLIRCSSVGLAITALLRTLIVTALTLLAVATLRTLLTITVLRTLAITTLALLTITTLGTLAITALALLTIATLRTLAITALTLLTVTTLVVITGTVAAALRRIALQTCTEPFGTEAALIVVLTIVGTLKAGALSCMDTRTRRASLSYLSLKTILLCWFFVFLFIVLKIHSWSVF